MMASNFSPKYKPSTNTPGTPGEIVGILLAGGSGKRLRPLTNYINKNLLPIGGEPLISRTSRQLVEAGVKKLVFVIDESYASDFMSALKDGKHLGAHSVAYVWQPPGGHGMPAAISQVAQHISSEKLVVACGDVLIENGISKPIQDFMQQESGARLAATSVADSAGFSPMVVSGENVLSIEPKDKTRHRKDIIDLGIYMYHRDVFEKINRIKQVDASETDILEVNSQYVEPGEMKFTLLDGWWSDAGGSIAQYLEADAHYTKSS